jgi:hypothetical protein
MGLKGYQLTEHKTFIAPETTNSVKVENGNLTIPANSAIVFKLTQP